VKCAKVLDDGFPCQAEALRGDAKCLFHSEDPGAVRTRSEASRRGGLAAHAPVPEVDLRIDLSSSQGLLDTLARVAEAVAQGRLDRSRAGGIIYAVNTAATVHRTLRHEERLRELERRVGIESPE
jgi:hypothetical protein